MKKLSKYFFFTFLFLLPIQTVWLLRVPVIAGEKWQYGTIGVYLSDLVLFAAIFFSFAGWFIKSRKNQESACLPARQGIRNQAKKFAARFCIHNSVFIILLVFWSGLSIFWATDQVLAGYFFAKLCFAVGAYFIARSMDETDMRMVIRVMFVGAVLESMLGIWQFLSQSSFASTLLGMSGYESWTAGVSVLKLESGRFLRAYGTFPHPNMLGGYLAVVLVLCISYYVSRINNAPVIASDQRERGNPASMSEAVFLGTGLPRVRGLSLVMTAGGTIILLGLILTFSRMAWLGFGMGLMVLSVVAYRQSKVEKKVTSGQRPWNYVTLCKTMAVLGVATTVFVFILRDEVFPRFDSTVIGNERSVEDRVQSLRDAEPLIANHSFLGVGAGNFTVAVLENKGSGTFFSEEKKYPTPTEKKVPDPFMTTPDPLRPVWSVQPAHNVFVLVLAELGVVGLVLFVFFFGSVIASVAKQSRDCHGSEALPRNDRNKQSIVFVIALLALVPSLFLDHFLWSSHFGLLFFFLLAGLAMRKT